jgi:hypothetical protein
MSQQEKGFVAVLGLYFVKNTVDIGNYPEKAIPVGAMPREPSPGRVVYRSIGGFAVTALVGGPDLDTLFGERSGKRFVTQSMFGHTMNKL